MRLLGFFNTCNKRIRWFDVSGVLKKWLTKMNVGPHWQTSAYDIRLIGWMIYF